MIFQTTAMIAVDPGHANILSLVRQKAKPVPMGLTRKRTNRCNLMGAQEHGLARNEWQREAHARY